MWRILTSHMHQWDTGRNETAPESLIFKNVDIRTRLISSFIFIREKRAFDVIEYCDIKLNVLVQCVVRMLLVMPSQSSGKYNITFASSWETVTIMAIFRPRHLANRIAGFVERDMSPLCNCSVVVHAEFRHCAYMFHFIQFSINIIHPHTMYHL